MSNKDTIIEFCRAWSRLDPAELADYFTEDSVYHNMPAGPVKGRAQVEEAIELTRDFVDSTYLPVKQVAAKGGTLKDAYQAMRAECDAKFKDYAIYEHCLPFNVARAYDEARGIAHPRIWTDKRDLEMWDALQG